MSSPYNTGTCVAAVMHDNERLLHRNMNNILTTLTILFASSRRSLVLIHRMLAY